jgi:hypothetical protein
MKRLLVAAVLVLAVTMIVGTASAYTWVVSPYSTGDGTIVFGSTDVVAVKDINDPEGGTQTQAIYGAGFTTNSSTVNFDADLYTWDSYSASYGWWDAFVVNINQTGFYWDLVAGGTGAITDPLVNAGYAGGSPTFDNSVLPGSTWVFGGTDWGTGSLESVLPLNVYSLSMAGGDPNKPYYVSVVLDTKTPPTMDTNYPSWGSFHIVSVPEPSMFILFGSGLASLAFFARRRKQ